MDNKNLSIVVSNETCYDFILENINLEKNCKVKSISKISIFSTSYIHIY
ncbi:hypothetical protein [Clostridium baratii]